MAKTKETRPKKTYSVDDTNILEDMAKDKKREITVHMNRRPNGSLRVQQDCTNLVSKADKTQMFTNDVATLVKRMKPDALAAYLAMRNPNKPIVGYDFSKEPTKQEAMNEIVRLKRHFKQLPQNIQDKFKGNFAEFIKFVDNPDNKQEMIDLGLLEILKKDPIIDPPKTEPPTT